MAFGLQLTAYSCGGSYGLLGCTRPIRIPFQSLLRGTVALLDKELHEIRQTQSSPETIAKVEHAPPRLTFVLGGARSGKSAYAENRITTLPGPWIYCATAEAFDDDMRGRIALHRMRRAKGWQTIEAPLDLPDALAAAPAELPVLIDCLTLWTSNLMLADRDIDFATTHLLSALAGKPSPVIIVSNEVGLGIVPDNALARTFRDEAGRMNQRVAAAAVSVVFMVAGLPIAVKGPLP